MKGGQFTLLLCSYLWLVRANSSLRIPRESEVKCTAEDQAIGHSLCLKDSPYLIKSGVSPDDKIAIVKKHNTLRANVDPPATDMMKMFWDDRLAAVAQKWANQCTEHHDKDDQRYIKEIGKTVGQNQASGHSSWNSSVQTWYNEVKDFSYGFEAEGGWKKVGHFTQVVQGGSFLIGCGYAECSTGYKKYHVCNYVGSNLNTIKPYTSGPTCDSCSGHCTEGLCDCGGRICLNDGHLNLDSCECKCPKLYEGDTCEKKKCPKKDKPHCEQWKKEFCDIYSNVPEDCPFMCGKCP